METSDREQRIISQTEVVTRLDQIASLIMQLKANDDMLRNHIGLELVKAQLVCLAQDIDRSGAGHPAATIH